MHVRGADREEGLELARRECVDRIHTKQTPEDVLVYNRCICWTGRGGGCFVVVISNRDIAGGNKASDTIDVNGSRYLE